MAVQSRDTKLPQTRLSSRVTSRTGAQHSHGRVLDSRHPSRKPLASRLELSSSHQLAREECYNLLLKLFEVRQYKKGLKTCDQILKKFPEHGESHAVKGLFLTNLDRKEEGYTSIKHGLEIDPNSSISWHVYGLVYRADQKYADAVRCYQNALKTDSENIQILRDLAQLQTQLRQYDQLVETRMKLVKLNPSFPSFWIGLALAHQLNGRYDSAIKVLTSHEEKAKLDASFGRNEISEMLMYKNWLIELKGDYQAALENLKEIRPRICDVAAWKVQKANLLLKVGRKEQAAAAYQDLIERNPDNKEYVRGYLACNGLDLAQPGDKDAILEVVESLQAQFPRSNTLKFLPLTFCEGESFAKAADALAKHALRKGIPSLFTSMKTLYANEAKGAALGTLFEGYATQLRDTKRFDDSAEDESATAAMWCTYYLAQHADYYGDYERALQLIDDATKASPDTVELYMVKAKILKHAGDIHGARQTMDFARGKDLKDRFVNSKTVKYMLRDDEVDEAEKMMVMFVRDDAPHKIQEIVDSQAIWYMRERGDAYRRLGDIGRALKQYHQVQGSFDAYHNDQFDFHSYSLRKVTMRSYVDILAWEDQVYSHDVYVGTAHAAIACYIDLHDRKAAGSPILAVPAETSNKPVTRNGSAKQGQHTLSAGVGEAKPAEVDKDPNGSEYIDSEDYLGDALKFVERLESAVGSQPETHLSAVEIHLRMKKYFLVLKSLNALKAIDENHPSLVPMVVRMSKALDADESFAAPMKAALKAQLAKSFGDVSIDANIKSHAQSLDYALAGAKGLLALGGEGESASAKALLLGAASESYGATRTLANLRTAKGLLKKAGASETEVAEFANGAKQLFPLSTCF
ncbi:N-terminal acetyltransferase A, auxiliary subunit [Martensiomyces pterosporus]|nr:N-terminal acetyltransferase A, auxiliary subunit [Martensiomyces pterosporus]